MISRFKKQFETSRAGLIRCAVLSIVATLAIGASSAQAVLVPISGLFPTGVNASGNALPGGTVDPHYALVSSDDTSFPIPTASVVLSTDSNPFPSRWVGVPDSTTSAWISANPKESGLGSGMGPGVYMYELTFTLAAGQDPATAQIQGEWAADTLSMIYLNGTYVLNQNNSTGLAGDPALKAFNIPSLGTASKFVIGVNHLDFVVFNAGGAPSGLIVTQISGSSQPMIPEPSTVVMALIGGVGLGFAAWRKRRSA